MLDRYRERDRKRERGRDRERESVCVCVREREREIVAERNTVMLFIILEVSRASVIEE